MGRRGRSKEEGNGPTPPTPGTASSLVSSLLSRKAWSWSGSSGPLRCRAPCTPAVRTPAAWRLRSMSGPWWPPPCAAPFSFSSSFLHPLSSRLKAELEKFGGQGPAQIHCIPKDEAGKVEVGSPAMRRGGRDSGQGYPGSLLERTSVGSRAAPRDVPDRVKAATGPRARTPAPSGAGAGSLTRGSRRLTPSSLALSVRTWSRPQSNRTRPETPAPTLFEAGREIKTRISDLPPPPA